MNIHGSPRKTKPPWLEAPCSLCPKYEETEDEIHDARKAGWNPLSRQHFNRCKFHPLLCGPELAEVCPYKHLIGTQIWEVTCDRCGKVIAMYEFGDPKVMELAEDPNRKDICEECERNPNVEVEKELIIISSPKKKREDET